MYRAVVMLRVWDVTLVRLRSPFIHPISAIRADRRAIQLYVAETIQTKQATSHPRCVLAKMDWHAFCRFPFRFDGRNGTIQKMLGLLRLLCHTEMEFSQGHG